MTKLTVYETCIRDRLRLLLPHIVPIDGPFRQTIENFLPTWHFVYRVDHHGRRIPEVFHNAKSFDSTYTSENANYDPLGSDSFFNTPATGVIWGSGGGISTYFAQPSYQTGISSVSRKWRLVPDVALHMGGCPGSAVFPCGPNRSGDISILNGATVGVIGTSAAAPDFAGLLALRVELTHGRLGNENYRLYTLARAQAAGAKPLVFRTSISGNNGYATTPGYNLVLGNGTVFGAAYLGVANQPLAGIPKSASNP